VRKTFTHVRTLSALTLTMLSIQAVAAESVLDAQKLSAEPFPESLIILLVALAGLVVVARRYGGRDPREVEQELERRRRKAAEEPARPGQAQLP
jgi:hypothetical protein